MVPEKQLDNGPRSCSKIRGTYLVNEPTFNKPKMQWRVASTSNVNLDEKKFIVDSGASVHMTSKMDHTSATRRIVNRQSVSTSHDGDDGEWVDERNRGGNGLRE